MNHKQFWISLLIICWLSESYSQETFNEFNTQRERITKKGMLVLGSWALVNVVSSPFLANSSEGSTKYFYQMNGYWNGVNLLISGLGYLRANRANTSGLSLSATIKEQHSIEKVLLLNAGLDIAYITGGFYLKERAKNSVKNRDRFTGFGNSLVLQGGFLFAFDLGLYLLHKKHSNKLLKQIELLSFTPGGVGMIIRI